MLPATFVDLGVVFESVTSGVSVALALVLDFVTWPVNECDKCVLMATAGVAFVGAEVVGVVNCVVGACADWSLLP